VDLKRLRYFVTIVEQGSVSKAAQLLCIAQPPLSKRLQELEDEVGTPLLSRQGKRLAPTSAGLFLYQRACEILRSVEDARRRTVEIAATERRVLRVGVSYLFLRYFQPLIRTLYVRNPRAEIAVSVSDSSHLEDLLRRDRIDVALMQRPKLPEAFDVVDLPPIALRLAVTNGLVDSPPGSVLAQSALHDMPLILLRRVEGVGTFESILDHLRKAGVHPNVTMYVSDPAMAIAMLDSGIEAAVFVPASEVAPPPGARWSVHELQSSPLVFAPAAVRLSTTADLPEVREIILDWGADQALA